MDKYKKMVTCKNGKARRTKSPFDRRLLELEREINKLAREVKEYKTLYSNKELNPQPKKRPGRKPKTCDKKDGDQPPELDSDWVRNLEAIAVEVLLSRQNKSM